eukprot:scaffold181540_cov33-Tisochrysis_lutea.AAC.1
MSAALRAMSPVGSCRKMSMSSTRGTRGDNSKSCKTAPGPTYRRRRARGVKSVKDVRIETEARCRCPPKGEHVGRPNTHAIDYTISTHQWVSGCSAHRRQLIRVTDEENDTLFLQRLKEPRGEVDVKHRRLVDHNSIALKRTVTIP